MKKIAIISFFHSEASLVLSKYIAQERYIVDFYFFSDLLKDTCIAPGFEYRTARKKLGKVLLRNKDINQIKNYIKGLKINFYLIRIISFSKHARFINKLVIKYTLKQIKESNYYAINIIGQHRLIKIIHDELLDENITHTLHELHEHTGLKTNPLLDSIVHDRTKTILCSKSVYDRFVSLPGIDKNKVFSIPFGIFETIKLYEDDQCKLDIRRDNRFTFLFYGFIHPYKGLDLLYKALEILSQDNDLKYKLIIAGAGYDKNIENLNKWDHVQIINEFISNADLNLLLRISDCVLCPYKSVSQSGITSVAFMYGVPIIATRLDSFLETIRDRENGLLVEPNSPEMLCLAMKEVMVDKVLMKKLKNGAIQFGTKDDYDWHLIAKKTIDVLSR